MLKAGIAFVSDSYDLTTITPSDAVRWRPLSKTVFV